MSEAIPETMVSRRREESEAASVRLRVPWTVADGPREQQARVQRLNDN